MSDTMDTLEMAQSSIDVRLDERKMYVVTWADGAAFGFTVTPVQSDLGTVLCLTRRTSSTTTTPSLQDVMPGDLLIAIGDEKVYRLGPNNATKLLRSVQKPARLTLQLASTEAGESNVSANEYTYLWESGPLGIVLKTDSMSKLPVVKRFTGKTDSSALERNVNVGDELIYVNQTPTGDHSIATIIHFIKELPKPITLRFRKAMVKEVLSTSSPQLPKVGEGEYEFLWEVGPLGLVVGTSPNGFPFVQSFTGQGDSKQLAQVQENDEIILVNDRSVKEYGFNGIMQYIMNVPKPATIRFRRSFTNRRKVSTPTKSIESSSPLSAQIAALSLAADPLGPHRASSPAISMDRASSPLRSFLSSRSNSVVSEKEAGSSSLLGYRGSRNDRSFTLSHSQRSSKYQQQQQPVEDSTFSQSASGQSYVYDGHQVQPQQQQQSYHQQLPPSPYKHEPLQQHVSVHRSPPRQPHRQRSFRQSFPHHPTAAQLKEDFFEIDSNAYYQIQWTDGPFGFTVREAQSKQGYVVLITKRTGKSTCAGLRRVAVGDILIMIGDKDVRQLGFERSTIHLRNVPKPVLLTFQAID